jgi:multiple sugar transport system permease protein
MEQSVSLAPGRRRFLTRSRRRTITGLLFASPWIVGFVCFALYPILASAYYSLTDYSLMHPPVWVGLGNYIQMASDPDFWTSLGNTLFMVVFDVPTYTLLAFLVALALNQPVRALPFFRTVFMLPWVMPGAALATLFLVIFNPDYGLLNSTLDAVGIMGPTWINDAAWAKPSLILMDFWTTGFWAILFLAALQGIPREFYEAASLDGAGYWTRTLRITVPLVSPVTLYGLITGIIAIFGYFTTAYIFTSGAVGAGPDNSLEFYALYLYNTAFKYLRMGYASALAWVLFVITLVVSLLLLWTSRRWAYYEGEARA